MSKVESIIDTVNQSDNPFDKYLPSGRGTPAGDYLRRFWQPVFTADLLEPGKAKPITIMNEHFAIYRSQEGKVHCVDQFCAHRGAPLHAGWVEGDHLRCPYHGWAYDGTGQCVDQPCEHAGFKKNIRIGGYPAQEYLGLIFVYFGEGEPPELPRYKEWEDATYVTAICDIMPCNWLSGIDNIMDDTHVMFTHMRSAFQEAWDMSQMPKMSHESTPWGIRALATSPDGRVRTVEWGMPNVGMFKVAPGNINKPGEKSQGDLDAADETIWHTFLHYRVPVDDYSHLLVHSIMVNMKKDPDPTVMQLWKDFQTAGEEAVAVAKKVLSGELHFDDIPQSCHHVPFAQDTVVQAARPIADRRKGVEHLGAGDVGVIALRKLYDKEIKASAAGEKIRNWPRSDRPEGLLPKAGV